MTKLISYHASSLLIMGVSSHNAKRESVTLSLSTFLLQFIQVRNKGVDVVWLQISSQCLRSATAYSQTLAFWTLRDQTPNLRQNVVSLWVLPGHRSFCLSFLSANQDNSIWWLNTKSLFLKGLEFLTHSGHSVNAVYYYHSLWGHEQKGLVTVNSVVNTFSLGTIWARAPASRKMYEILCLILASALPYNF